MQTVDALVSVAPSCICARRTGAVPPAFLCHLLRGLQGGVGKLVVVMILSGEEFSGNLILFFFGFEETKIMPWDPGKRERRKLGLGVWPCHEVDISLCVLLWTTVS